MKPRDDVAGNPIDHVRRNADVVRVRTRGDSLNGRVSRILDTFGERFVEVEPSTFLPDNHSRS
jgi:hypothetical protein